MKKSGVSQILITVIMIGLVLVAIGVVWAVISNILSGKSEEVSSGSSVIGLEVKNILINSDGNISVFVERDAKQGEFSGIKFIISDGENQYFYERDTLIENLETKIYVLNYSGVIESIEVAPIYSLSSGKTKDGNVVDKFEPSYENSLRSMNGLVSWWKFESNADDVLGRNNGSVKGATLTTGKYGNGYQFHGIDDNYIQIADSSSLRMIDNLTMSAWIKPSNSINTYSGIIGAEGDSTWGQGYDLVYYGGINYEFIYMRLGHQNCFNCYNQTILPYSINLENENWHHVVGTFEKPNVRLYIDGNLVNSTLTNKSISNQGTPVVIGALSFPPSWEGYWFNGSIDEVMIFNRSLSADEVKALYNAQN